MARYCSVKWILFVVFIVKGGVLFSQQSMDKKGIGKDNIHDNKPEAVFNNQTPMHNFDVILGRPTNNSITISILSYHSAEAYVSYNIPGETPVNTEKIALKENKPTGIVLSSLKTNTKYNYRIYYKRKDATSFIVSEKFYFQTQRNKNVPFNFTITADSHLDQNTDTLAYKTTLLNVLSDSADFHIDLGDTYMTDKYRNNYKEALNQYIAQCYYFGLLGHSSSLFFVLGNHDGESGQRLNGQSDNITVWSTLTRKEYYPNPYPNDFYTGNDTDEPFAGLPQNYYAWEWGNALFVVLDPFRYTPRVGTDNPWDRTLGKKQYDWLTKTLENSKASIKFIFIHNLVGGADVKGRARGGAEVARLYEWGGHNNDGADGFTPHRPDWEMPIHNLLVKHKVTAVFHGHDHLFAKQELDGIIYQCLPQPGAKETGNIRQADEYGYVNGVIKNGPGYMRINVSENSVTMEFVSTNLGSSAQNRNVVYSYDVKR